MQTSLFLLKQTDITNNFPHTREQANHRKTTSLQNIAFHERYNRSYLLQRKTVVA
jgi:hypothetical protein